MPRMPSTLARYRTLAEFAKPRAPKPSRLAPLGDLRLIVTRAPSMKEEISGAHMGGGWERHVAAGGRAP